jgi:hypothetical protein
LNILFFVLLPVNFAISWLNARNVGRIWSESKQEGGAMRVLAVSGYIMAVAGFTMVYGCLLLILTVALYPQIPFLYQNIGLNALTELTSDLLYVLIAFAVIPTGVIVWLQSVIHFWRRRTIANAAVAGWNTFANTHNIVQASRELPNALGRIAKALFGGKKNGNAVLVLAAVFIVVCALLGGWMTASAIMKRADRKYDLYETIYRRVAGQV